MVERAILNAKSYSTRKELWLSLPKKMQYQTFSRILQYLEVSRKILIDDDGQVTWTFPNNDRLKKLLKSSVKLR